MITLLGAGNVATHLGLALKQQGYTISQVYSRTYDSAVQLAERLDAEPVDRLGDIKDGAVVYLCALSDDALESVLSGLTLSDPFLVHTSGSIPLSALSAYSSRYGVLYPLQTFSKTRPVDVASVPFFIEASNDTTLEYLTGLASRLSRTVHTLNSDDRAALHLAAVFACNFVNHLYTLSFDILKQRDIPFHYLLPLIDETALKVHALSPADAQTGPAVRNDTNIITKQLQRLSDPVQASVYRCLTDSIINSTKQH